MLLSAVTTWPLLVSAEAVIRSDAAGLRLIADLLKISSVAQPRLAIVGDAATVAHASRLVRLHLSGVIHE